MKKGRRNVEQVVNDTEYINKRREYDQSLKAKLEARAREADELIDELSKFGLHYTKISDLVNEPENTFALAITRMVEFLDIFRDPVNLHFLISTLGRPEGTGFVAKPMIEFYKGTKEENLRFQAARAILATAESDDANAIAELTLNHGTSSNQRRYFVKAVKRLRGCDAVPFLFECLKLDDATVLEAMRALSTCRSSAVDSEIAKFRSHENPKVRQLVQKILRADAEGNA